MRIKITRVTNSNGIMTGLIFFQTGIISEGVRVLP
jgi:hypothetical protein